jgi:hypothetical protein
VARLSVGFSLSGLLVGAAAGVVFCACLSGCLLGCSRGGSIGDRARAAGDERVAESEQAALSLVESYAKVMASFLPQAGIHRSPSGDPAMTAWRQVVAWQPMAKKAEMLSGKYEGTPGRKLILDGLLVIEALSDYWLGRVLSGLQEIGDLGNAAADGSDRVDVPLSEHLDRLTELAERDPRHPWQKVIAFERLLPHFRPGWRFLANGRGPARNDIPFMASVFELEPLDRNGLEESYSSWRDRLCSKLKGACRVPYEHRNRVVAGAWAPRMGDKLDAYIAQHGEWSLTDVVARLRQDLADVSAAAVIPPEYPVLPDTRVGWSVRPLSQLLAGSKGVRFESKSPGADVSIDVLAPVAGWKHHPSEVAKLAKEVTRLLEDVARAGAMDLWTGELYLLWEDDVPMRILRGLSGAAEGGLAHLWFVGRRRYDDSLRMAAFGGVVPIDEDATPVLIAHGDATWDCAPIASLGGSDVSAGQVTRHLFVDGKTLTLALKPPPSTMDTPGDAAETPDAKAPTAGDAGIPEVIPAAIPSPITEPHGVAGQPVIRKALWDRKEPVLLALHEDVTWGQLHTLVDTLALEENRVARNLLLAVCKAAPTPEIKTP